MAIIPVRAGKYGAVGFARHAAQIVGGQIKAEQVELACIADSTEQMRHLL